MLILNLLEWVYTPDSVHKTFDIIFADMDDDENTYINTGAQINN